MFALARKLAELGVMGINRRNAWFTLVHNPRRLYPLVDDKVRTKRLALDAGIPVPDLYAVVEAEHQVRRLTPQLKSYQDFVVKPAHGTGGDGILVVAGRANGRYRTGSGHLIDQAELDHHIFNILSGLYSLGGQPDQALIEYRSTCHPVFDPISFQGVPDIRIVVFLGVPVMAMLRLPTRKSQGKANLHQGAVGAGVDLATGRTLTGSWQHEIIEDHPDTGHSIRGIDLPDWETMLDVAARCYDLVGLGYLGVDLVLDRLKGPLLLELNARPGLHIQVANGTGLLPRIRLVEEHRAHLGAAQDRVAFARKHFGAGEASR